MAKKLFAKGQSGNPSGRPKIPEDVRELARAASIPALKALIQIADDAAQPAAARVSAASSILDRAWGKPAQAMTGEGGEGPVKVVIEWPGMTNRKLD